MPRTCPSSGKLCTAPVCNEGGWPCDPSMMAALQAQRPSHRPAIEETEEGLVLGAEVEDGPSFKIED